MASVTETPALDRGVLDGAGAGLGPVGRYGPQTAQVLAVLEAAAALTPEQVQALVQAAYADTGHGPARPTRDNRAAARVHLMREMSAPTQSWAAAARRDAEGAARRVVRAMLAAGQQWAFLDVREVAAAAGDAAVLAVADEPGAGPARALLGHVWALGLSADALG